MEKSDDSSLNKKQQWICKRGLCKEDDATIKVLKEKEKERKEQERTSTVSKKIRIKSVVKEAAREEVVDVVPNCGVCDKPVLLFERIKVGARGVVIMSAVV